MGPALCLCQVAEGWKLPAFLWNIFARILVELCTHGCELHKGTESWVVKSPCYTMESTPAEEEEKPAMEGERRRKILIAIASFSILLGFFMMVVGCVMLGQYNIFLDFVTPRYTEGYLPSGHWNLHYGCFRNRGLCCCYATLLPDDSLSGSDGSCGSFGNPGICDLLCH